MMELKSEIKMEYPISSTFRNDHSFPSESSLCDLHDCLELAASGYDGMDMSGGFSPGTDISGSDESHVNVLDDLISLQEFPSDCKVGEILNELVIDDPNFGQTVVEESNVIPNDNTLLSNHDKIQQLPCDLLTDDIGSIMTVGHSTQAKAVNVVSPSRRKQRIIPMDSQPCVLVDTTVVDIKNVIMSSKSLYDDGGSVDSNWKTVEYIDLRGSDHGTYRDKIKSPNWFELNNNTIDLEEDTIRDNRLPAKEKRKRGLSNVEKRNRKRESNRNASFRYRQRRKQQMEEFQEHSDRLKSELETEKRKYYAIMEEFMRCVKNANFINDVKGKPKLMLK